MQLGVIRHVTCPVRGRWYAIDGATQILAHTHTRGVIDGMWPGGEGAFLTGPV